MARPRTHLDRAPIVEAVVDFRVLRNPELRSETFSNLGSMLGEAYSQPSPIHSIEATFGVRGGKPVEPTQVSLPVGWAYKAEGAVAQLRLNGFTFSKLEPYSTWQEVFGEASRLWRFYVETAKPLEVSRIAVRYINRLRLPGPAELGQYLEAPPVLPRPIPQAVREFLTRIVVVDQERDSSAMLVQALEASLDPTVVPLLIDIDAFREGGFSPQDPAMPMFFDQLRQLKNEIFFATVTERTVEMFA